MTLCPDADERAQRAQRGGAAQAAADLLPAVARADGRRPRRQPAAGSTRSTSTRGRSTARRRTSSSSVGRRPPRPIAAILAERRALVVRGRAFVATLGRTVKRLRDATAAAARLAKRPVPLPIAALRPAARAPAAARAARGAAGHGTGRPQQVRVPRRRRDDAQLRSRRRSWRRCADSRPSAALARADARRHRGPDPGGRRAASRAPPERTRPA